MVDLFDDRLELFFFFMYCVVDYFGFWLIKEGWWELKRYGVLFICLVLCVIYFEIVNVLIMDVFINVLWWFFSCCGLIRFIWFDWGINFVGVKFELENVVVEMDEVRIYNFFFD